MRATTEDFVKVKLKKLLIYITYFYAILLYI